MTRDKKAAIIKTELIALTTYPYADPSPIPEFGRLYPYNRFDGYTNTGTMQDWEMIVLENDFIKLWVNPAVGGKIWGAVEKATGKEFIYFNHAAKFRDVAMRGPWTSGGMETNMGIIGHSPACSSPVDYTTRSNADGSVSCFIGATDWPSRTRWTVEINLPADAAAFSTRSSWFNNSDLEQSYYQWNNVGVKTTGNLEYINPGQQRIGHDGKALSWPKDEENREISFYDKNNFGEYKSYHIFGSIADFWGCYWHDDNFGFGHAAAYDEKPGKKIWIWGLSRYGMIWENLLTDTDGQYTELQSGRLFNQSIAASSKTPFKHSSFAPYAFDHWDEYWFPVKNIDGLGYGNQQLSFNITQKDGVVQLHLCANQPLNHTLKITQQDKVITSQPLTLGTMQTAVIALPNLLPAVTFNLWLNNDLVYNGQEQTQPISRPSVIAAGFNFDSVQAIYTQAKEWERQRFYQRAVEQYEACLKKDPFYLEALAGLAGLHIRQKQYQQALNLLTTALSINTYHPESNYLYGLVNSRLNNIIDAKDGFSIASIAPEYRAAAHTQLAKIFFREQALDKALNYIKKALAYNTQNQQALQLELIINRLQGMSTAAKHMAGNLIYSNPLNHLVRFELYQLGTISAGDFQAGITSELPYETYIEVAAFYFDLQLYDLCLEVLALAPAYAMVSLWIAYLHHLKGDAVKADEAVNQAVGLNADLVFPHREEDVTILEWAANGYTSWKLKYYLALTYIQMLRTTEALQLLQSCINEPDFYAFYIVRASLLRGNNPEASEVDRYEAFRQAPDEWRTILTLSKHLGDAGRWCEAQEIVNVGYQQNTENYYLGLQLAKCLMHTASFEKGITLMNQLNVLPNEGASEGRNIWKETHLLAALKAITAQDWQTAIYNIQQAKHWPENMGVGRPYDVDERLENFLAWYCLQQSNQVVPQSLVDGITLYRQAYPATPYSANDFLSVYLLQQNNAFAQAQEILSSWQQTAPDDLALQWTLAFTQGNTAQLNKLALIQPPKREPLPYEILFEDRSFPFVKEMYAKDFFKTAAKPVS